VGFAAIVSCYLFIWLISENYAEGLIKKMFMRERSEAMTRRFSNASANKF
jgi:hypothetical protein